MKKIFDKLKSIKFKDIPWRRLAPWAGAIIGIVFFLCLSLSTMNDTVNKRSEQLGLVTRFPTDSRYFFDETEPETGIVLSWYDNTVRLGTDNANELRLDAVMYPITATDRTLEFSSSDTECAEIDADGNITAKKPGSIEITVANEAMGITAKAYLQIIQPVMGFYLKTSSVDLYITDTSKRIETVVYPENASNTSVRWYSKDTKIVEVDQTGHLKPKSRGMAEVVATTADGDFTAKCFVNVINETIKVEKVNILNKPEEILAGTSNRIIASVLPANARNKVLNWQSSDDGIVSVTKTGVITGIKPGTATIVAQSSDGAYDAFDITVKADGEYVPTNNVIQSGSVIYIPYDLTLEEMAQIQMNTEPKYNDGSGLKTATKERTMQYLDPNEFSSGAYKYQFMDLSHYNGISRERLAAFLNGKGILSNKAEMFIAAARQYNVSELYLVAHACLETGYGTSKLATGVMYNGVRVYNMFGIGAFDSNAVATGAKMAFEQGWTSPEAAILGGAKWISQNYINSASARQNTLYKMRWNPDNPGQHLYAGDIAWAVSQALIMENLFSQFREASVSYEVPVYMGSVAAVIDSSVNLSLGGR